MKTEQDSPLPIGAVDILDTRQEAQQHSAARRPPTSVGSSNQLVISRPANTSLLYATGSSPISYTAMQEFSSTRVSMTYSPSGFIPGISLARRLQWCETALDPARTSPLPVIAATVIIAVDGAA